MTRARKKKADYYHVTDGEWVQPATRGFKEQCCSCGLVHRVDYRIKDGKIQFRATVDGRATGGARKHKVPLASLDKD
jgi:hypothetical protein